VGTRVSPPPRGQTNDNDLVGSERLLYRSFPGSFPEVSPGSTQLPPLVGGRGGSGGRCWIRSGHETGVKMRRALSLGDLGEMNALVFSNRSVVNRTVESRATILTPPIDWIGWYLHHSAFEKNCLASFRRPFSPHVSSSTNHGKYGIIREKSSRSHDRPLLSVGPGRFGGSRKSGWRAADWVLNVMTVILMRALHPIFTDGGGFRPVFFQRNLATLHAGSTIGVGNDVGADRGTPRFQTGLLGWFDQRDVIRSHCEGSRGANRVVRI